jgi:TPR repeat protein
MGVPEDFDRAAHYLIQASDAGEASAKVTLAEIYAMGKAGGTRKEASALIREVLAYSNSEEAMDVYNKYELNKV